MQTKTPTQADVDAMFKNVWPLDPWMVEAVRIKQAQVNATKAQGEQ